MYECECDFICIYLFLLKACLPTQVLASILSDYSTCMYTVASRVGISGLLDREKSLDSFCLLTHLFNLVLFNDCVPHSGICFKNIWYLPQ